MLLALRPLAATMGLIDSPGGRKTHHGEVPVVGGIAMFTGLLVAAIGGQAMVGSTIGLLVVAAFMVALGILDDRFNLPPNVRLFAHLSAAVAMVYSVQDSVASLGNLFGWGPVNLGIFAMPFTVVAVVALINAFNMLDGLDGLAGTSGLIAFGGIMIVSSQGAAPGILLVAGSMFGAVAAFLIFNLPLQINNRIRTFMGDAGSTLLGFVLAGLSLRLIQAPPDSIGLRPDPRALADADPHLRAVREHGASPGPRHATDPGRFGSLSPRAGEGGLFSAGDLGPLRHHLAWHVARPVSGHGASGSANR